MSPSASFQEQHAGELLSRTDSPDNEQMRALLAELWSAGAETSGQETISTATAIGVSAYEGGEDPGEMVGRILRLGRALADSALGDGAIDAAAARRVHQAADRAAAESASAYIRAGYEHREAWLSFLCHDLKNPLNTLLNALWLIREHRTGNIERFLELAERAVRRMESGIRDVRELAQKERTPPKRK